MFFFQLVVLLKIIASLPAINSIPLFEGDIAGIDPEIFNTKGAAAVPTLFRSLWPNGIVPYTIDPSYTATERQQILSGMKYLEDATRIGDRECIKFVPRTVEIDWVRVFPDGGCYSLVGKVNVGGSQDLSLARPGCLVNAIVAHEFMHALGFWHEQSRPDRDNYVTIFLENVQPGLENNFNKYNTNQVDYLDEEYDYDSVMHYNTKDFSKNGLPTILPNDPTAVIGQRKYISRTDIAEIRKFYNCV